MAIKLLVKVNNTNYVITTDPTKDRRGVYKTGYIVEQRPDSWIPGGEEIPPKFICVRITDLDDLTEYIKPWNISISYSVVGNDPVIDGWRLRATADYPGVSNRGSITRTMVENFLNRWNATVFSTSTNSVTFDVAIFADASNNPGALQSVGFWEVPIGLFDFTEISYNQTTGEHRLSVDYSFLPSLNPEAVRRIVIDRGGEILYHASGVIEFIIFRNDVRTKFQEDVKRSVDRVIYRRQYYLDPVWVQDICDNQNGYVEVTTAELLTHLGNKLNDNETTLDTHSLLI